MCDCDNCDDSENHAEEYLSNGLPKNKVAHDLVLIKLQVYANQHVNCSMSELHKRYIDYYCEVEKSLKDWGE